MRSEGAATTAAGTVASDFTWSGVNYIGRNTDTAAYVDTDGTTAMAAYKYVSAAAIAATVASGAKTEMTFETVRLFANEAWDTADHAWKSGVDETIRMDITFIGASTTGDQYSLECRANQCGAGCNP